MKPTKEFVEKFIDDLHGSGIDADWNIQETKNSFRALNSYHAMDENGFYVGWQDFVVIFLKNKDVDQFKLQFQGDRYLAQKFMLRDYLDDTIAFVVGEIK